MQLTFEPVTNRIGDDYFIVPKNDEAEARCVMKCNDVAAFIVNLLVEDQKRDSMIAATAEWAKTHYPNATEEEIINAVDGVRKVLKDTVKFNPDRLNPDEGGTTE